MPTTTRQGFSKDHLNRMSQQWSQIEIGVARLRKAAGNGPAYPAAIRGFRKAPANADFSGAVSGPKPLGHTSERGTNRFTAV
jgi:hypothetical protein